MAYDRNDFTSGADTFGFGGATINLSSTDFTVGNTVKAITVVSSGNIVFRAPDSAADITITGAPVGYVIPWHCSFIRRVGTTATLATIIGR
jgi:hypothetical protein